MAHSSQNPLQKLLLKRLAEHQSKNPAFSLRAFSRQLQMTPATVSRVLNGKRGISLKLAQKLCDALLLDPQERTEILDAYGVNRRLKRALASGEGTQPAYSQLDTDHFKAISDWQHFAILSLMKLPEFQNDNDWIAARLGVSISDAQKSLETLKRLGIVKVSDDGALVRSEQRYRTSDDVVSLSLRKAHAQGLELARRSLEADPLSRRDFTSITLAMNNAQMARAKEIIRAFHDEFAAAIEGDSSPPDSVYRLCVQLFPLTKVTFPSKKGVSRETKN